MVEVFREIRRVLAAHGTVWLNLGDSYASDMKGSGGMGKSTLGAASGGNAISPEGIDRSQERQQIAPRRLDHGLKQKDLVGIPWRVAFALQADGWYLRSDIIWSKPNPMPESVTDRPTKAHEYVFLLSKQPRYFFDQEAVREPHTRDWRNNGGSMYHPERFPKGSAQHRGGKNPPQPNPAGRNIRSVWEIATQPYPEAHFATFPEELARRAIAAGCPEQVCRVCGVPRTRITEASRVETRPNNSSKYGGLETDIRSSGEGNVKYGLAVRTEATFTTLGFSECECRTPHVLEDSGFPRYERQILQKYRPGIVLDPFMGSGTVAYVARKLGRHSIGIDLSAEYLALAARRLQQQSLLTEISA